MAERRGERIVPISEAAELLGISKDAVRMRIKRGTLRSEKRDDRVYVHLNDVPDAVSDADPNALVGSLQDQVSYLRDVIATRDEEIRRRDVIISQLTSRIPELTAAETGAATQPPAAQHQEGPESREEGTESAADPANNKTPARPDPGAQEGVQRPWWKRLWS